MRARQQRHVWGQLDRHVQPGRLRVDDAHPGAHPLLDQSVAQDPAELGELDPVVDALGLPDVVERDSRHEPASSPGDGHHVGQIGLAGCVVGGQLGQRQAQELPVERVDPAVDLAHGQLRRGRVLVFHDGRDGAVALADDASVPTRVVDHGGQDGDGLATALVLGHELEQRLGGEQRHVAVRDEHGAVELGEHGQAAGGGASGALQVVLVGGEHIRGDLGEVRDHGIALVADDNDEMLRVDPAGRSDGVADQGASGDRMQHLGGG